MGVSVIRKTCSSENIDREQTCPDKRIITARIYRYTPLISAASSYTGRWHKLVIGKYCVVLSVQLKRTSLIFNTQKLQHFGFFHIYYNVQYNYVRYHFQKINIYQYNSDVVSSFGWTRCKCLVDIDNLIWFKMILTMFTNMLVILNDCTVWWQYVLTFTYLLGNTWQWDVYDKKKNSAQSKKIRNLWNY